MDNMYFEFAKNVKTKLLDELNGKVIFEIYKNIDTIIFKIYFKDFDYSYAVNSVWDRIYSGEPSEVVVADFIAGYKKAIKNAFFKSEEQKKRDQMVKMEELV